MLTAMCQQMDRLLAQTKNLPAIFILQFFRLQLNLTNKNLLNLFSLLYILFHYRSSLNYQFSISLNYQSRPPMPAFLHLEQAEHIQAAHLLPIR